MRIRSWLALASSLVAVACGSSSDGGGGTPSDGGSPPVDGAIAPSDGGAPRDGAAPPADADAASPGVDAGPPALYQLVGRFDTSDPAGPKFEWPSSAVYFRADGTQIDAKLDDSGNNLFEVVVDGATSVLTASAGAKTYTLAKGLAPGAHDVLVYRRSESFFGPTQFLGATVTGGAGLVAIPAPYARTIEFVGDSITCGYGDEGNGPNCQFTSTTENEYLTYAAITARNLHAAQVTIAWSGIGIYRNYGGDMTMDRMPTLWDRTLPENATSTWGFHGYVPDVVVINLGTNDFSTGDPGSAFQDAWTAFLQKVRGHYPNAFIFGAVGPMLDAATAAKDKAYIQAAIDARKAQGDTRLGLVEFATQDANDGLGCDYHPSLVTHQKMAVVLTAAIQQQLGW